MLAPHSVDKLPCIFIFYITIHTLNLFASADRPAQLGTACSDDLDASPKLFCKLVFAQGPKLHPLYLRFIVGLSNRVPKNVQGSFHLGCETFMNPPHFESKTPRTVS